MATIQPEDVVIRHYVGDSFQLIDAATQEQIAIVSSVDHAVRIAGDRAGAVWEERVDPRAFGTPELVLLQSRAQ